MFARILVFEVKLANKDEFVNAVRDRLLPILEKQTGFLEFLPFLQKSKEEKAFKVSLWTTQRDGENYEKFVYPAVLAVLKPYLLAPAVVSHSNLETTLCDRFVDASRSLLATTAAPGSQSAGPASAIKKKRSFVRRPLFCRSRFLETSVLQHGF